MRKSLLIGTALGLALGAGAASAQTLNEVQSRAAR